VPRLDALTKTTAVAATRIAQTLIAGWLVACGGVPDADDELLDDGATSGFVDSPTPLPPSPTESEADSGAEPATRDAEGSDDDGSDGGDDEAPGTLDDEFDDDDLDGWAIFHDDAASYSVDDGQLHFEPGADTVWLSGQTSILLWKEIGGDFMVTASLRAVGLQDPEQPPPPAFRFGGLMARSSADGLENTVHIAFGTDDEPSVETKSTVDEESSWQGPSWPSASGELRICRLGESFRMYVRELDGPWVLSNTYARPDLPDLLEVGPMAFNNSPTPDLRVSFDYVRFAAITSQADCER
jgi:hypothetical protein